MLLLQQLPKQLSGVNSAAAETFVNENQPQSFIA